MRLAQQTVIPAGTGDKRKPSAPRVLRMDISALTLVKTACAVATIWLLMQLWPILLVIVVALMLVGMLAPPIAWLERRGMGRGLAIGAVFLGVFLCVSSFSVLTVPSLGAELIGIVDRLPQTQADIADRLQTTKLGAPLARSVRGTGSTEILEKIARGVLSSSASIIETVAYAVTCFFLSLYLIVDRDRMRGALFAVVPRTFHVRLSRIILNLETIVGGYMRGQVITSLMMAAFTLVVLVIARVPDAIALAAFAGVMDVLPYVGGLLACGPAVLSAWPRGAPVAIAVLVVLASYQELESRVIVPRIYGRTLRLPAASVMVALLVGGKLLGILGALLALPIAAGVRMVIEELRFELPGEDIDDSATRKRDAREERAFERLAAGAPAEQAAAIAFEIAEERMQHPAAPAAPEQGSAK